MLVQKKTIVFFFYCLALQMLYSMGMHLSSLGDSRLYAIPRYDLFSVTSPETATQVIYTMITFNFLPVSLLGILFTLYVINNIKSKFKLIDYMIILAVFNPFVLQFFFYHSKEFLMCVFLLLFHFTRAKVFNVFILVIRIEFLPVLLSQLKSRFLYWFIIIAGLTAAISLFVYFNEVDQLIISILNLIRNSFLTYEGSTNRDFLPIVQTTISLDFIYVFLVGFTSVFYPFTSYILTNIILIPVACLKILLFWRYYKYTKSFTSVLLLLAYSIPLSIYNSGSALRYTIPMFFFIFINLYIPRRFSYVSKHGCQK